MVIHWTGEMCEGVALTAQNFSPLTGFRPIIIDLTLYGAPLNFVNTGFTFKIVNGTFWYPLYGEYAVLPATTRTRDGVWYCLVSACCIPTMNTIINYGVLSSVHQSIWTLLFSGVTIATKIIFITSCRMFHGHKALQRTWAILGYRPPLVRRLIWLGIQ